MRRTWRSLWSISPQCCSGTCAERIPLQWARPQSLLSWLQICGRNTKTAPGPAGRAFNCGDVSPGDEPRPYSPCRHSPKCGIIGEGIGNEEVVAVLSRMGVTKPQPSCWKGLHHGV